MCSAPRSNKGADLNTPVEVISSKFCFPEHNGNCFDRLNRPKAFIWHERTALTRSTAHKWYNCCVGWHSFQPRQCMFAIIGNNGFSTWCSRWNGSSIEKCWLEHISSVERNDFGEDEFYRLRVKDAMASLKRSLPFRMEGHSAIQCPLDGASQLPFPALSQNWS